MKKEHRYARTGNLALSPQAFGLIFLGGEEESEAFELRGDVAIVNVIGPLEHRGGWWCDSYEAIRSRFAEACESSARTIVLRIDSPGGDVSGCFETARELRRMAAAAGKRLLAFSDGSLCSGAYALACSAEKIVASETALVGSIGVINTSLEVSAADRAAGLAYTITTSGARKADGHPHLPMSKDAATAIQSTVDALAGSFFGLVGELRGLSSAFVESLEAGIFTGPIAQSFGLVDHVSDFETMLAGLSRGGFLNGGKNTMATMDDAIAALKEAAAGEGPDAERAKRALAAYENEESAPAEEEPKEEEAPAEESAEAPAAEGAAPAASGNLVLELARQVQTHEAELAEIKRSREREQVSALLATRKDITPKLRATLAAQPLARVREILDGIPAPKPATPAEKAAAGQVTGTRGESQGTRSSGFEFDAAARPAKLPPEERRALDLQMGLISRATGVVERNGKLELGAFVAPPSK